MDETVFTIMYYFRPNSNQHAAALKKRFSQVITDCKGARGAVLFYVGQSETLTLAIGARASVDAHTLINRAYRDLAGISDRDMFKSKKV